jgi:hypothetical protein
MDHTACTEPQCLYNGALYLFYFRYIVINHHILSYQSVLCHFLYFIIIIAIISMSSNCQKPPRIVPSSLGLVFSSFPWTSQSVYVYLRNACVIYYKLMFCPLASLGFVIKISCTPIWDHSLMLWQFCLCAVKWYAFLQKISYTGRVLNSLSCICWLVSLQNQACENASLASSYTVKPA